MKHSVESVARWIANEGPVVAFTGAGISTESGIPDFRSADGIWSKWQPVFFDDFVHDEESRREFWRQKSIAFRDFASALPNRGHQVLADWQQRGLVRTLITQNIDGLHQLAGSTDVLELHGNAREVYCLTCRHREPSQPWLEQFGTTGQVPACPKCGGILKLAIILFGEMMPEDVFADSTVAAEQARIFLVAGSSLSVQPAASLPMWANRAGARLVIINRDPTMLDDLADAVIREPIGETLSAIDQLMD